ncbi:MAG: CBS domain-containing protein [Methanospirillum sp.]|uniref:CBS domain-containing protein n=1 Tax=Methanospirillum sp. TaxID=45200 RepID=UPI0023760BFF|nr:CBS domain-containing protein [Methanospirillum sp.]MDD1729299.1 CBS domain-containing protein [Methanospirillum sp.]
MTYANEKIQLDTTVAVRDIMRRNPKTIDYRATVADAARKMCNKDPSGSCIVLRDNVAVGIVTEQDLNCKVVAKDIKPSEVYVNDIMTSPLITIHGDKTVEEAAHEMIKNRVRRLPIVNEKGIVIGIVSVRDIVAVSTEINELMSELVVINQAKDLSSGMCSRCGRMSDDLKNIDGSFICSFCMEEDRL